MIVAPRRSPIAADPSQTGLLRDKFSREFQRRFNELQRDIIELLVEEDAFGLKSTRPSPDFGGLQVTRVRNILVANNRWRFLTSDQKVTAFQRWLKGRVDQTILDEYKGQEDRYWKAYIDEGYKKGAGKAFDQARKSGLINTTSQKDFYAGSKTEFFRTSFGKESVDKVKLLASRVLTDLVGVTTRLAGKLSRALTDGLVSGQNPRTIASTMVKDLGFEKNQADVIARTEIIRAHAEGQLDSLDKLGVAEVGVAVEWSTAGDGRVCKLCAPMDGVVYKVKEAHGLIPRHPRCRCAFLPANVGESSAQQLKRKSEIEAAMRRSVRAEIPKGSKLSVQQQMKRSRWVGSDLNVAKKRPESLIPSAKTPDVLPETIQRDFLRIGSKEELAEVRSLVKERKTLNDAIKAGTASESDVARSKAVAARIAELRKVAKERIAEKVKLGINVDDLVVKKVAKGPKKVTVKRTTEEAEKAEKARKAKEELDKKTADIKKGLAFDKEEMRKRLEKELFAGPVKKAPAKKAAAKASDKGFTFKELRENSQDRDPVLSMMKMFEGKTKTYKGMQTHGMSRAVDTEYVTVEGSEIHWIKGSANSRTQALRSISRWYDQDPPIPQKLVDVNKRIIFSDQRNNKDSFWEKEYNMPGFKSHATGGDGSIVVYNGNSLDPSSMAHESGHNLAKKMWDHTKPPMTSEYGKIQKLERPVSSYGSNSPAEDFAEACMMYATDQRQYLKVHFPKKFKYIDELLSDAPKPTVVPKPSEVKKLIKEAPASIKEPAEEVKKAVETVTHYHGTLKSNVDSILKEGISSKASKRFGESSLGERGAKVFTTSNPEVAEWYGKTAALYSEPGSEYVVFEINVPADALKSALADTSSADSWMFDNIPPEWIKVVRSSDARTIVGNADKTKLFVPIVFDKEL